jgi:hypothetical protein
MKIRNITAIAALLCVAGTAFGQATDDCAAAPSVGAGTYTFSLAGASNSFVFAGACGLSDTAEDVWLKLVATSAGEWVIETCGQTADDTVLSVVSACDGSILVCNDDSCDFQSRVTVNLTAGQEVFIRITEYAGGTTATGSVVISAPLPPGNIEVFTDQAAFNAAVSSPGTDNFDDLPPGVLVLGPLSRSAGAYGYSASAANDFFPAGAAPDVWLSTNTATSSIVFDNFTGGVFAFSGFFFGSDINGLFVSNPIRVSAVDASGIVTRTITATDPTSGFLGFRSSTGILSVTVTSEQPVSGFIWPTVNDVTLAAAGAPACRPDLNSDGELTFDDIQLFISLFNANDNRADFNNDQEWTFDDIQLFISLYNAGC